MAMAVAAACCLALPAGASAQQGLDGLTSAATGAVAATGSAVEDTVTTAAPLAGPAQGAVEQVAATVEQGAGPQGPVAGVGASTADATRSVVERVTRSAAPVAGVADGLAPPARRAVDETLRGATAVDEALHGATGAPRGTGRDNGTAGASAGQGSPRVERLSGPPAGRESSRASRLRLGATAASERPHATLPSAFDQSMSSVFTPLIPGPSIGLPGAPAGGSAPGSGAADGVVPGLPSGPGPVPGAAGGSSAAGASVSFSLGGLALLLATLSLAGPALRRRLPRPPVMGWPAAFVPLLERPG
jgi:hypothetical protein